MGASARPASSPPALAMPERVGRYELLAPIASGGMATVYLARARGHGGFEREVAVKLTHPHLVESPEFAAVLLDEAKLAVRIRHSNVVSVLDVGVDDCGVFLVMEYVEGDSLLGLARGGELPTAIGVRILLDGLAGLHAAHELRDDDGAPLGVVHRDFSPHNLLVGTDGVAKLTDFGIAKAATRAGHTGTGIVKGKVSYMAPEQARGLALDRRCDVWAAGVVAWELFARRRLYEKGDDGVPVLLKVISEPPPRLRDVAPHVSAAIEEAVASALTLDPAQRCPTAAAFARRLADAVAATERIADAPEVGELVATRVGPKLAERRSRAHARLHAIDATETVPSEAPAATTEATTRAVFTSRTHATPAIAGEARAPGADESAPRAIGSRRAWRWGAALAAIAIAAIASKLAREAAVAPSAEPVAAQGASAAPSAIAPPAVAPPIASSAPIAPSPAPASPPPRAPAAHPRATIAPRHAAAHATPLPEPSAKPIAPGAPGKLAPSPW